MCVALRGWEAAQNQCHMQPWTGVYWSQWVNASLTKGDRHQSLRASAEQDSDSGQHGKRLLLQPAPSQGFLAHFFPQYFKRDSNSVIAIDNCCNFISEKNKKYSKYEAVSCLYAKSKLVTARIVQQLVKSKHFNSTGDGQTQASNFAQAADFPCEA